MTTTTALLRPARTSTVLADDGALLSVQVHEPMAVGSGDGQPTTLVLAHGWTLSHHSWDAVVARLAGRPGLRVVTWDQRGHGRSTLAGGRYRARGLSIKRLARDLDTVLAAVAPEGPLVLGGHSMGGMTVMAYAGLHPDTIAHRVHGVALVATSAGGLTGGRQTPQRMALRALALGLPVPAGPFITAKGQRALLFGDHADPQAVEETRRQVASTRLTTLGGFHGALMQHDELASLPALGRTPVHVLVGDRDRLTSARHARAIVDALPHATLELIPGAGHMLPVEATDRVVAHLDGLLAVAGAGSAPPA